MVQLSGAVLAVTALAYPALAARQLGVRTYAPAAKQASSANVVSSNVLTLTKTKNAAKSAAYLGSLRSSVASANYTYGSTPLDNLYSEEYVAQIEWAGIPVEVIVDTGSSDTWLVQAGFTCVDEDGNVQTVCSICQGTCDTAGSRIVHRKPIATSDRCSMAPSTRARSQMRTSTSSMAMASS